VAASRFETSGASFDQKIGTGTYLGVEAEWLESKASRTIGTIDLVGAPVAYVVADTEQRLDFRERSVLLTLNQLVGRNWSLGGRYRLSDADLRSDLVEIPSLVSPSARRTESATLHQLNLFARFHHESGFFGGLDSIWSQQSNRGYTPDLPGDDFWQFNVHAGYRFLQRRVELKAGVLNLTDRDYRLNPLNLTTELPRERTLVISFKFSF
jgi:outer membrane receptor for monomeric catechols